MPPPPGPTTFGRQIERAAAPRLATRLRERAHRPLDGACIACVHGGDETTRTRPGTLRGWHEGRGTARPAGVARFGPRDPR